MAALARPLAGQSHTTTELDAGPLATWARRDFYGFALGVARRPGGQGRVALLAAGGVLDARAALRLEATVQFLVSPGAQSGASPYGGIGAAYVGSPGMRGSGVLVALVGVEAAPARRGGWFGEIGLGQGLRVRLGYRWRRFPPGWS